MEVRLGADRECESLTRSGSAHCFQRPTTSGRTKLEEDRYTRKSVLIACSDPANSRVIEDVIRGCSLESLICPSAQSASTVVTRPDICLVFCDDVLPDGTYRDLLAELPRAPRRVPLVVVMLGEDRDRTYREAMEQGAFDVIVSPCARQDVQWVVIRAMDLAQLARTSSRA